MHLVFWKCWFCLWNMFAKGTSCKKAMRASQCFFLVSVSNVQHEAHHSFWAGSVLFQKYPVMELWYRHILQGKALLTEHKRCSLMLGVLLCIHYPIIMAVFTFTFVFDLPMYAPLENTVVCLKAEYLTKHRMKA